MLLKRKGEEKRRGEGAEGGEDKRKEENSRGEDVIGEKERGDRNKKEKEDQK